MEKTSRIILITDHIKSNKYSLLITLGFFLAMSYVSFFHHPYFYETDGMHYLNAGTQILQGDGKNVKLFDAPIGGPVLYATLNLFFHDGFFTLKIISLLSGTGIVFFSYHIIKNIFNPKIALLGQLFFAFNPRLHLESIWAMNEILPVFLIYASLYFVTKKSLKLSCLAITGSLLGVSFMIRYPSFLILLGILIFTLIHSKKIRTNLFYTIVVGGFFLIIISPLLLYNLSTYGRILDADPAFYMIFNEKYQTHEWLDKLTSSTEIGTFQIIFTDFDLFLKNYFYNLFYHNPNLLFNFNTLVNTSIIPPIPFLGIIPVMGGLIYFIFPKLNKKYIVTLSGMFAVTGFFVFLLGDPTIHFFAIIIIPVLVLGALNIRNIEKRKILLLVLAIVFLSIISIIPVDRPEYLFPMWILIPTLSSLFIIDVIPKIYSKISNKESEYDSRRIKIIIILLIISLVLLVNLVFSYKGLLVYLYQDTYDDFKTEFLKLFQKNELLLPRGMEEKQIGDILAKQPGIENSYVMAGGVDYAYFANSKFVWTSFQEGIKNDAIDRFISRDNWSDFDIYVSNTHSYPFDRYNTIKPVPDYLIYGEIQPHALRPWDLNSTQFEDLKILLDPNSPKIPSNFELLYKSNKSGMVVYRINHER